MPYTTDPTTGAQVPTGTAVPATSRDGIRTTLTNHESRLGAAEAEIDALQADVITDSLGNIGIGTAALEDITTGTENVCLGVNAGKSITSGVQNVALGPDTLEACTTGSANIAVGDGSLGFLVGGVNNIALGDGAGRFAYGGANLTNSTASIYLGQSTRSGGDEGADYEIVIGYNAEGAGDNTTTIGTSATTAALIYGKVILNKPLRLLNVDFGGLAALDVATYESCIVYYSPGSGNKKIIFSDGAAWRYMDGTAV